MILSVVFDITRFVALQRGRPDGVEVAPTSEAESLTGAFRKAILAIILRKRLPG